MDYQIRPANSNDVQDIIPLWKEMAEFHESMDGSFELCIDAEEQFAPFLKTTIESQTQNDTCVLVAELKATNQIVGYLMCMIGKNPPVFKSIGYGNLTDICVTKLYRRQKIGCNLVMEAKKWFNQRGIHRIQLHAATENPMGLAFWKKMGFIPYMEKMYFVP